MSGVFSPSSPAPLPPLRQGGSAGRRTISSPGPSKGKGPATPSRIVRTPNATAQLVQLDASEPEFARLPESDDDLDDTFSEEEIVDETENRSRRASRAKRSGAPSESPPPQRQTTEAPRTPIRQSPSTDSLSITPSNHAFSSSSNPLPAAATELEDGSRSRSPRGRPDKIDKVRPRPAKLSSNDVEAPGSPENPDTQTKAVKRGDASQDATKPPPTTATKAVSSAAAAATAPAPEQPRRVLIDAETPMQQRKHQQAAAAAAAEGGVEHPATPPRVTLGNKHLIGSGSFGTVYRALDLTNNRSIAVKEIRLQHMDDPAQAKKEMEGLEREIRVMSKLSHPNIVKYLGYSRGEEGTFNILMEFVSCGTVSSLIRTFGPLQPIQAALFTKQILAGLEYLHGRRIAHRDLKGDNLFVDTDGTLKVGDFGTAKELQTMNHNNSVAGTPYFMAPEVIKNGGHGLEADVWSLGCCVIQMLTGNPPYKGFDNSIAVMFQVSKGNIEPQIPSTLPEDAKDFIRQCCRPKPKERPSCAELLQHPWIGTAPPLPPSAIVTPAAVLVEAPQMVMHASFETSTASQGPATRGHARSTETPPRPGGSGKLRTMAGMSKSVEELLVPMTSPKGHAVSGERSPPPTPARPGSKDPAHASRGVAAARAVRQQTDRPSGASATGTRRSNTPQRTN
jgi:serine/threonine protein kinase